MDRVFEAGNDMAEGPAGPERPLNLERPVHWSLNALERVPVAFCRIGLRPDRRIGEFAGIERLTGYAPDEFAVEADLIRRIVHPDDRRRLETVLADPAQLASHSGIRLVHRDGHVVCTDHVGYVARDDQGHPTSIDLLVRDITVLRDATAIPPASPSDDDLSAVHYLAEPDGFVYVGRGIQALTGFSAEEWKRQPTLWVERLHPDDRARMLFLCTGGNAGQSWQAEYRWLARDGRIIWIRHASAPIRTSTGEFLCHQGLLLEGAVPETAEPTRIDLQRMQAMARLAGVVAHDLNNVLTVVLGHAEMLADALGAGGRARDSVLEIRNAAETAARITNQLLALSGRQAMTPGVVHLNELVYDLTDVLHQLAGGELELRFDLVASLPPVEVDPKQMERVLRNLVVDARDANGERLTIATGTAQVSDRREVVLTLTDARPRLSDAAVATIFEPVVGTRKSPRGSSLNRAAIYGIIGQAGGRITADQAPAGGLTFTITLPAKG